MSTKQKPKTVRRKRWTYKICIDNITTRRLEELLGAGMFEVVDATAGKAQTILVNSRAFATLRKLHVVSSVRYEFKPT